MSADSDSDRPHCADPERGERVLAQVALDLESARRAAAVLDALNARGSSLAAWARERGYLPDTAYRTVRRWAARADRPPQGVMAHEIITELRRELGSRVLPRPVTRRPRAHGQPGAARRVSGGER